MMIKHIPARPGRHSDDYRPSAAEFDAAVKRSRLVEEIRIATEKRDTLSEVVDRLGEKLTAL